MSYILEALKKSEQERKRGSVPDIKSVHNYIPTPIASQRTWWPWILLLVVAINVVIFGVVFFGGNTTDNSKQSPDSNEMASANTPQEKTPSNTIETSPSTNHETASKMPAASVAHNTKKPEPTHLAKVPVENHHNQQSPRVIVSKVPLTRDNTLGNTAEQQRIEEEKQKNEVKPGKVKKEVAMLPADLPDNIKKQLPSIAFEGHVYSSTVSRRSVMINGKKMRQGDAMSGGLIVKQITPLGAEFEYQGYLFKLNALQDWSYR